MRILVFLKKKQRLGFSNIPISITEFKHSSEFSQKPANVHCMEKLNLVHTRPSGLRSTFTVPLHLLLVFQTVLSL